MAYNTAASLDKLTCTDYVDFGKYQDQFGQSSWSQNDSNYLDRKLRIFKKDDNKEFRLVQNLTKGVLQISLEFKKWLLYKDSMLKDTNLLS